VIELCLATARDPIWNAAIFQLRHTRKIASPIATTKDLVIFLGSIAKGTVRRVKICRDIAIK
jgi:hypothetical protein